MIRTNEVVVPAVLAEPVHVHLAARVTRKGQCPTAQELGPEADLEGRVCCHGITPRTAMLIGEPCGHRFATARATAKGVPSMGWPQFEGAQQGGCPTTRLALSSGPTGCCRHTHCCTNACANTGRSTPPPGPHPVRLRRVARFRYLPLVA